MSKTPHIVVSDKIVWVDVDDTLVCWNLSSFPKEDQITVNHVNGPVQLVPHRYNINTIRKFWKLGYTLVVHSGSGYSWAEAVVKALNLEECITLILSKPKYFFDDYSADSWAGPRIWRDPITGKSWNQEHNQPKQATNKKLDIQKWIEDNSDLLDDLAK